MMSVEQIIQELLRIEAEASQYAGECRSARVGVVGAATSLNIFDREAQGAAASLSGAAKHLLDAQGALEQLRGNISRAVLQLSK